MILSLDIGTSSVRAMTFSKDARVLSLFQKPFVQVFPELGWVEQDAEEIVAYSYDVLKSMFAFNRSNSIPGVALGISNQRESIVVWDKHLGKPIYNAIIWQDSRTEHDCQKLKDDNCEPEIRARTGLCLDPYFSATKISWILDNVIGARQKAENGDLLFGTIDSYFIFCATKGSSHVTDATNASRTCLLNIQSGQWDPELFKLFNIPICMAPQVKDSSAFFGRADDQVVGEAIDITGVAGDQQAAMFGQACFSKGDVKATFGTGCFALVNIGSSNQLSEHRLLNTIGYQLEGKKTYAIEGAVFAAGSIVSWMKEGIGILNDESELESICHLERSNQGVYLVPAFDGLGAPHWRSDVNGAIFGLTRSTTQNHIIRAGLESVVYQTNDLFSAMKKDEPTLKNIRVDGGMTKNAWLMQFLADITREHIERAAVQETSALGAAFLAGLYAGVYDDLSELSELRQAGSSFACVMSDSRRERHLNGWRDALKKCLA